MTQSKCLIKIQVNIVHRHNYSTNYSTKRVGKKVEKKATPGFYDSTCLTRRVFAVAIHVFLGFFKTGQFAPETL